MFVSMKKYPVLLWGLSALFSMESKSVSIPEISNFTSTTQLMTASQTAHGLTTANKRHYETEQQPAVVSKTYTNAAQTPPHKPAETSVPATQESTLSHKTSREETVSTTRTHGLQSSTAGVVAGNTLAETTSSSAPQASHNSTGTPAVTMAADTAQPSSSVNISEPEKPTNQHRQLAVTSTDMFAMTSETEVVSSLSNLPSTTADHSTQASFSIQEVKSSSVSAASQSSTIMSLISTLGHLFDPSNTSLSDGVTQTSTTSTGLPSASQPISTVETLISSTGFPEKPGQTSTPEFPTISEVISTISNISTSTVSTSAGVLIPHIPKTLPVTSTKSPTTTATPTAPVLSSTQAHSCASTRDVVKHSLIAIASLAALATIFMVSTIILCTKLSSKKYRINNHQQETEMMCISSLLPERNYTYSKQRNPISNGVLVIPCGGDSDEDGGDNLTLSSFLPENDRVL
ncbi:hypothetical protein LDENG_00057840 [Lucifuga dentata]|nr:hypothetical protein LDENG_00057840 [Lucifuga dentata]